MNIKSIKLPDGTICELVGKQYSPVEIGHGKGTASISLSSDWDDYKSYLVEYKPIAGGSDTWQNLVIPYNNRTSLNSFYYSTSYFWTLQFAISDGSLTIGSNWTTGKYGSTTLSKTSFEVWVYGLK